MVAAVGLFTFLQTPVYTAEATLLIEPTDPQVIDIKHVFVGAAGARKATVFLGVSDLKGAIKALR